MYNRLLAVSVAMTETKEGDGGFCIIRGSHKSNMPCPPSIQRYEQHRELVDNVVGRWVKMWSEGAALNVATLGGIRFVCFDSKARSF